MRVQRTREVPGWSIHYTLLNKKWPYRATSHNALKLMIVVGELYSELVDHHRSRRQGVIDLLGNMAISDHA